MKTLLALVAAFAAGFQTFAAVSSLPIGSVEKVLNHELMNTHQIVLNVQSADNAQDIENGNVNFLFMRAWRSYTKAGTTESINALCQRSAATSDKAELKALLQTMMREALRVSVDPNDPKLQGKVIAVLNGGTWSPSDPENYLELIGTFIVDNEFVLGELKDSQGKTIIPESAYEVDMGKAITRRINQGFFIDGIVKGEIRNEQGNVLESETALSWLPNKAIVFNNAYVFGQQPGVMQLWYTDGTSQTFSLADGSLVLPLSPTLTIASVQPVFSAKSAEPVDPAVKLTVTGGPGSVTLEYSENLKNWQVLTVLTNTTGSVSTTDSATGSARFYRARVGN
ncbi:MAG: hypothetical protein HYV67_02230 [Candidatus Taylorbacteria bacterium]|nr:hypothetical protein [Candidatus Taylorbacteria bacterium]